MSKMEHTPGPWFSHGRYIGTKNHKSAIAECRDINGNWSDDAPASANARLIAASPDLLNAGAKQTQILRSAQAILSRYLQPLGLSREQAINELLALLDGPDQREAQDAWDLALTKVTGSTPSQGGAS